MSLPTGQQTFLRSIRGLERDQFMEDLAEVAEQTSNDSFDLFEEDVDPVLDVNQWELRSGGICSIKLCMINFFFFFLTLMEDFKISSLSSPL